jgi:hypothetical protein
MIERLLDLDVDDCLSQMMRAKERGTLEKGHAR